jgi:hypothetical protein
VELEVSPERRAELGDLVKVGTRLLEVNSPLDETMGRREVSKFVRAEKERLGGAVPGANLVDFFRTLGKIVKGGVQTDPARSLQVLEELGSTDFLERIDAGDRLQPLWDATA